MKCPIDQTDLVMADRSGVEIDYCPKCRGVWLDRGELDKIIERSGAAMTSAPPPPPPQAERYDDRDERGYDGRKSDSRSHRGKRRRENPVSDLLGDIFDF